MSSRHGSQSDANDSSLELTGGWWGCYLHSSVPLVAAVYATLQRQSARFRCRPPTSSPRVVFPHMLEIVCDWRLLYARHTVEKFGLIAPLRQASHFPVFDGLSTSLKYLAHSTSIFSVATQVDLPFQCGTAVGLFLPSSMACALWLPARDGNGCW